MRTIIKTIVFDNNRRIGNRLCTYKIEIELSTESDIILYRNTEIVRAYSSRSAAHCIYIGIVRRQCSHYYFFEKKSNINRKL